MADEGRDDQLGTRMRSVATAGAARVGVLLLSVLLVAVTNRLAIDSIGLDAFGVVNLVVTLSALFPFADLGIGAALMTELPNPTRTRAQINDLIVRANRVLSTVALVVASVACGGGFFGAWPQLLGVEDMGFVNSAVTFMLLCFAASIRLGTGARVLVATDRAHLAVISQGVAPVVTLGATAVAYLTDAGALAYAVAAPIGLVAANVAAFCLAKRTTRLPLMRLRITSPLPAGRTLPILRHSLPMLWISIVTPVMLQSDRVVLAQWGPSAALASYAVASQLYWPSYSVVTTAASPLWPRFAAIRARGARILRPWLLSTAAFAAVGVILAVGLIVATPLYQNFVGASAASDVGELSILFALLLICQAAITPTFALFTAPSGLRIQAIIVSAALIVKVSVTLLLLGPVGAAAPLYGGLSAVCTQAALLLILTPYLLRRM
ncbi:MAG: hypothetical protein ABS64_06420 [Microbacterium sp. SCN 69-37]|nr:MAG: hypothetical protein ABS64_06420 [Microbacterium sp. SCN 69-37]